MKEKTPEKKERVEKKKKITRSKTTATEEDMTTASKFNQTPSFITSASKSPDFSQILVKSDTMSSLPGKSGNGDRESKSNLHAKSISIIRTMSNHLSKNEEEKDSTLFDIIDSSFAKKQPESFMDNNQLSNSVVVSPTVERRQVSYSQAEALARLLGPTKAKKVTQTKMKAKALKKTNTTEFYDQLSEVIKVNNSMR